MNDREFEQVVLDLWMTSQVPLTRANLIFYTGLGHKQVTRHLDEMIKHGLLDVDSDDEGELLYKIRGSSRPSLGPQSLVRCPSCGRASAEGNRCSRCGQFLDSRLRSLSKGLGQATSALTLLQTGASGFMKPTGSQKDKSLVLGGALGLLGPLGWFYAGAWKETVPALAIWMVLFSLPLIKPLFWLLLPILLPLSALIGIAYTSSYNRNQKRKTLLLEGSKGDPL